MGPALLVTFAYATASVLVVIAYKTNFQGMHSVVLIYQTRMFFIRHNILTMYITRHINNCKKSWH
jgi:hypothetical protein